MSNTPILSFFYLTSPLLRKNNRLPELLLLLLLFVVVVVAAAAVAAVVVLVVLTRVCFGRGDGESWAIFMYIILHETFVHPNQFLRVPLSDTCSLRGVDGLQHLTFQRKRKRYERQIKGIEGGCVCAKSDEW